MPFTIELKYIRLPGLYMLDTLLPDASINSIDSQTNYFSINKTALSK